MLDTETGKIHNEELCWMQQVGAPKQAVIDAALVDLVTKLGVRINAEKQASEPNASGMTVAEEQLWTALKPKVEELLKAEFVAAKLDSSAVDKCVEDALAAMTDAKPVEDVKADEEAAVTP